jgi:pSer/pThr/pTyr-binding forkhead associated (FHA) protein
MAHATLIVSQPGHKTLRVELSDGVTTIGRAEGSSVRLRHDRNVSRRHAQITSREDGYWLSDLTTRNGTTINGNFVESEHKLAGGDVIGLGGTSTIEFCAETNNTKPVDSGVELPGDKREDTIPQSVDLPATAGPEKPKLAMALLGVIGGLAVIAVFAGILFATGLINREKSNGRASRNENASPQATPFTSLEDDEVPLPTPEIEPTVEVLPNPPGDQKPVGVDAGNAQILAAKISPKNYKFDPEFVALIGGYVNDYKSGAGYYARARKYRDAIDKEFVNVQGLPPVFGYVTVMSRTKFLETNGDVWGLPNSIVKGETFGSSDTDPSNPSASTKVAASYIRGLWDVFGKEGFMYVVACYGMSLDEAGEVQQRLEAKDPTGEGRYDFWRMKNLGVVKGEQVERVARFFAAGIVAENPQQYGLNEPSLSTLY